MSFDKAASTDGRILRPVMRGHEPSAGKTNPPRRAIRPLAPPAIARRENLAIISINIPIGIDLDQILPLIGTEIWEEEPTCRR